MIDVEASNASKTAVEAVAELRNKVADISRTHGRLTALYVAEDIEREEYLSRRRSLMSEKRRIEEKMVELERAPAAWVEPVRNWIKDASRLAEIAESEDLLSKK